MALNKKGDLLRQVIVHIILIGVIFGLFLMANAGKINGRGVGQQVVEKEVALLIDSAVPGMSFEIFKLNANGFVEKVKLEKGKIFVQVDGFASVNGYPYFSKYRVSVSEESDKFVVKIG